MLKAQHTIATPDAVLKVVQQHYPTIGASHCELLALGCNDNYRIKGKRQDYAFRLYRRDWWPEQAIDEELRFLEIMQRKKLHVCVPVRTVNKSRYIEVKAPEGKRYGTLFHFIPGRQLAYSFGPRNQYLAHLGNMVADMHTIADKIRQPIQRWTIGFDNVVTEFLQQAPIVLGHRERDLAYLRKLATELENILFDQPDDAFTHGLCHGDLHTHNVMLQPDGKLAIYDFDWCGYSWRAYDLATIWWALATRNMPMAKWRSFLRGYCQHRSLTKQEKRFMPWFVVFRHFEYLNFQLSMRPHIGSAWLSDNYYDFHLNFFMRWQKEHMSS